MASPQLQLIINAMRNRPTPSDPVLGRKQTEEEMARFFPLPADVLVQPVDVGGISGAWLDISGHPSDAVLYFLHGGGYVSGSIKTHQEMVSRICRVAGCRGFLIDYRLAPEHPFPAAVDDAVAAYRWVLDEGVAPSHMVIGGASAGGGLVLATLVALRDAGSPMPAAAACMSAWTDLEGLGESMTTRAERDPLITQEISRSHAKMYLGDTDPRNPLASPVYADLHGLPPLLMQVGDAEILLDDSTRIARKAKAAGVDVTLEVWDEMIHVWQAFAGILPEGQQAIERLGEFIRERLTSQIPSSAR
jgi:monoterpene epsilon-lactone hydrolase